MRYLLALAGLLLLAVPAAAEWPTTRFLPVPPGDDSFPKFEATADVETIDRQSLFKGAFGVLTDVMRLVTIDSGKLVAAGFPAPVIEPLITETSTGDKYYPLFWFAGLNAPMKAGCTVSTSRLTGSQTIWYSIQVNDGTFAYDNIANGYNAGGGRRQFVLDKMSATFGHEITHAIQSRSFGTQKCDEPDEPKWFIEGTADGVAHYLLTLRRPGALEEYPPARNERQWNASLASRNVSIGNEYTYSTGSFFRYLMEASETGASHGLAIVRDMLTQPGHALASREALLGGIDRIVKSHARGRGLYQVLPEFLTEYASYGVGRYKLDLATPGAAFPMTHERWLDKSFDGCVRFDLVPGTSVSQRVRVEDLAGECIHVSWSGFQIPVALQVFARGAGADYGDLHLGEAVRETSAGTKYCYDATRGLRPRLAADLSQKCLLRRGTQDVGGTGGGAEKVALWTSDFNLLGNGDVYYVLSNVDQTPANSKELVVDLLIGAVDVTSAGTGEQIQPRKPSGESATEAGMTDIDRRVHAMNGNEDRMLFDARSIFGQGVGLGFMEGLRGEGSIGEGVMTLVRGGNYWVGYIGKGPRSDAPGDGALIVKNPAAFEAGGFTPFAGAMISGGVIGGEEVRECGYNVSSDITILEKSDEQLRVRVTGDLFDFGRAMAAGQRGGRQSMCAILQAAYAERADFTMTLPFGKLYDGYSTVERGRPPGQDIYDDREFPAGPSLGGIDTSLQLSGLSQADPPRPDPPTERDRPGPGDGSVTGTLTEPCTCGCPDLATPPTPICRAQCAPAWQGCGAPAARAPRFEDLLSQRSLAPDVRQMLAEDFDRLSPAARERLLQKARGN